MRSWLFSFAINITILYVYLLIFEGDKKTFGLHTLSKILERMKNNKNTIDEKVQRCAEHEETCIELHNIKLQHFLSTFSRIRLSQ